MTKGVYLNGVMQRMNELGWDDSLADMFLGGDSTKVERHVEATFRDAWRKAAGVLPIHFFNRVSFKRSRSVVDASRGTGFVVLPLDFYALALFKMKGWRRACYAYVEENDAVASIQSNEFVRGNFCRPVCTVSVDPTHGRVLKYYSLPPGMEHVIESALYVPLVGEISGLPANADLKLLDVLYDPLMWINAGLVFSVFEKADAAKAADARVLEIV